MSPHTHTTETINQCHVTVYITVAKDSVGDPSTVVNAVTVNIVHCFPQR